MTMSSRDLAKEKAASLLKKRGSISSQATTERDGQRMKRVGSHSTISFMDDPGHEHDHHPSVRLENTYQMDPSRKFPSGHIKAIIHDVLEGYLQEEKYEPELCRQMTKTLSEVVKARVKELMIPRYKIICLIHIGQLNDHGLRVGSRCLWDSTNDTFSSYEFRNNSLFAIGTVYGIYME